MITHQNVVDFQKGCVESSVDADSSKKKTQLNSKKQKKIEKFRLKLS